MLSIELCLEPPQAPLRNAASLTRESERREWNKKAVAQLARWISAPRAGFGGLQYLDTDAVGSWGCAEVEQSSQDAHVDAG